MKEIKSLFGDVYEVSGFCGDCLECETGCETGSMLTAKSWTPEEVEEVCNLLQPSEHLLKLKNLGELK